MKLFSITVLLAHFAFHGLAAETNVFLEAGIPAADREWRSADYRLAAATFTATKLPLPRFSERHGKAVLDRLTSLENFSFHRNKTLPVDARMADYNNLLQGAGAILNRYLATTTKGQEFHKELATLMWSCKKPTLHKSSFKKKDDIQHIDEMLKELSRGQVSP